MTFHVSISNICTDCVVLFNGIIFIAWQFFIRIEMRYDYLLVLLGRLAFGKKVEYTLCVLWWKLHSQKNVDISFLAHKLVYVI